MCATAPALLNGEAQLRAVRIRRGHLPCRTDVYDACPPSSLAFAREPLAIKSGGRQDLTPAAAAGIYGVDVDVRTRRVHGGAAVP